ncbi:glycosyltransferase family 2 protein [Candidatus Ventrimonas sp. KK005]
MLPISIIMPVYNSDKYLTRAIESIINQTLQEWELFLIDDGSTDYSGKICDQYGDRDKRIKVIHQINNGMCNARNYCISKAEGKYIAFMDNDDICNCQLLEKSYNAAEQCHADIVKFGRESIVIDLEGKIYEKNVRELKYTIYDKKGIKENFLKLRLQGVLSPVWDGLYRKDLIIENNLLFDERLRYGEEDTIFCMHIFAKASKLILIPGVYYTHYIRLSHSASAKFSRHALEKYFISAEEMVYVLNELGILYNHSTDFAICLINHYVLKLILKLNYASNSMGYNEKITYLKRFRENQIFHYEITLLEMFRLAIKNPKKFIIITFWNGRLYQLLYFMTSVYFHKKISYMGI